MNYFQGSYLECFERLTKAKLLTEVPTVASIYSSTNSFSYSLETEIDLSNIEKEWKMLRENEKMKHEKIIETKEQQPLFVKVCIIYLVLKFILLISIFFLKTRRLIGLKIIYVEFMKKITIFQLNLINSKRCGMMLNS